MTSVSTGAFRFAYGFCCSVVVRGDSAKMWVDLDGETRGEGAMHIFPRMCEPANSVCTVFTGAPKVLKADTAPAPCNAPKMKCARL
jgi:hypothetical protein